MNIGEPKSNDIISPLVQSLKPVFQSSVYDSYPTLRTMINDYVALEIIDIRRVYVNIIPWNQ